MAHSGFSDRCEPRRWRLISWWVESHRLVAAVKSSRGRRESRRTPRRTSSAVAARGRLAACRARRLRCRLRLAVGARGFWSGTVAGRSSAGARSNRSAAMPAAHASIPSQSRKSPRAWRRARRACGPRSAPQGRPGCRRNRRRGHPLVARRTDASTSAASLAADTSSTSRPLASVVSVPSGPLLNSQTGCSDRSVWLRRRNRGISFTSGTCRRRCRSRRQRSRRSRPRP